MNSLVSRSAPVPTRRWYGSRRQVCRDVFAGAIGLADPFEMGQLYRRRFDARNSLPEAFSRAGVAVVVVAPLSPAEAAWGELLTRVHGKSAITPFAMSYARDPRAWGTLANAAHEKAIALPQHLWTEVFDGPRRLAQQAGRPAWPMVSA